jgi:hypothetical protein
MDGTAVIASPHCNIAVEHLQATKAIMFAVEHRYYGCTVLVFEENFALKDTIGSHACSCETSLKLLQACDQ